MASPRYKLELVRDSFQQDQAGFRWSERLPHFGLLDTSPDRWRHFAARLQQLNADAPAGQSVKLLLVSRHGQGVHNLVAEQVGEQRFLTELSAQPDEADWVYNGLRFAPDPPLTQLGIAQARAVGDMYAEEAAVGMPLPTSFYTSPMTRAIQTMQYIFERTDLLRERPPTVVEALREGPQHYSHRDWPDIVHDERFPFRYDGTMPANVPVPDHKRSTKSAIAERFPSLRFEDGFSEADPLWAPGRHATWQDLSARTRAFIEDVFARDDATVVAVSSHGGQCVAFQHVVGLPLEVPGTAAVLPLLVRATRIEV